VIALLNTSSPWFDININRNNYYQQEQSLSGGRCISSMSTDALELEMVD
jgi:hypothetical protein